MAKACIPVAVLVALAFAIVAHAGGNGSVKVDLYEASEYQFTNTARTVADGPAFGYVIFNPTSNDVMEITVKIVGAEPDTTFDLRVVPQLWGALQDFTLATNRQGNGSAHVKLDIPQMYINNGFALVKVTLADPSDPDLAYATDSRTPPFNNDTTKPAPGTTHRIDLKK